MENQEQGVLEVELEAPVTLPVEGPPPDPPGTIRDGQVVGAPPAEAPKQATEQQPQTPTNADPDDVRATEDGWKQRARRNERRAQKAESQVARLMGEFAEVKKQLDALTQGQAQVQQQTAAQHEQAVDAAYQTARQAYAQARASGDVEAEIAAHERFLEAKAAKDWVTFNKQNTARRPQQPQHPQQQPRQPQSDGGELPEAMVDWIEKNDWFKTDQRLQRRAMLISDEVLAEGIPGDDPEHYTEVSRRMKEEYGENFAAPRQQQRQAPARQPVNQVNRTATPPAARVQITEAHKLAAQQAGINLADPAQLKAFANQLAQTQARLSARGLR